MNKRVLPFLMLIVLFVGAIAAPTSASTSETVNPSAAAASFPYYDGFESGALGAEWTEYTTQDGRVRVSSAYPYSGTYSLLLDDSVNDTTYSYAAAILTIDLSGQSDVELDFWWREFDDEIQAEEGVFISDNDGTDWYKVYAFTGDTTSWHNILVDIDAQAAANGLTLNDHFQIKFQFYDNYSIASDGYAIDDVRVQKTPHRLYLPLVLNDAGPPTVAPVLNAINNPSGNYDYTVSWNAANKADEYILEEDDNASFSSPTTAYQGVLTSTAIGGKDLGTYYYRVKAANEFGESGWSNVESTTVTVAKPPCPQAGPWSGTTNQSYPISFDVAHSPDCEVQNLTIKYRVTCNWGSSWTATTVFASDQSITNDHFATSGNTPHVQGDFASTTSASGTWSYQGYNPFNPGEYCSSNGTWTASP